VTNADGWLPIHCLRILREPDEEVTPEDIVTISWWLPGPSRPTFLSIQMIQMIQMIDESVQCRQTRGSSSCSATSSAMPRLRALCRHTVRAELPAQARHACAAVL
jgi:hypothetical protein